MIDQLKTEVGTQAELARETLQILQEFIPYLIRYSKHAGELFKARVPAQEEFEELLEGLSNFSEGILESKKVLRISNHQLVDVLEADLLSILKDAVEFYQKADFQYISELLLIHLPENLEQWQAEGLPAIVSSRDS